MIVVTVFLSILNTNGIRFGSENRKKNCHHDHLTFNVKENGNTVLSVAAANSSPSFNSVYPNLNLTPGS